MDYYDLLSDVYRVQAGVGSDGEIYGALFLDDDPGILIGCSGGIKFVKAFTDLLNDIKFMNKIRVYLPVLTFEEISTLVLLKKKIPSLVIYVHHKLIEEVKYPRNNFGKDRYLLSEDDKKYLQRNLPKEIDDVIGFDKGSSFETEKTKILIIPFDGPHKGHSFIYSRDHKLLCTGILFGRTSDYRSYYIDNSGTLFQYENALSFVEGARSEVLFPIYDEPEFTTDVKFKVENMRDSIEYDKKSILEICTSKLKTLSQITTEFVKSYGTRYQSNPYDKIDLNILKIYKLLEKLVNDKQLIKQENQYKLSK